MKTRNCTRCGKVIQVKDLRTRYCGECKKETKQLHDNYFNKKQSNDNKSKAINRAKEYILKYIRESNEITTPSGFNEVSVISSKKIIQSFRGKTWVDILQMFGKDILLKKYIKNEYLQYINNHTEISLKTFADQHRYITYQIVKSFGIRDFLNYCERKILRNNDEDYENNFWYVIKYYGYVPLYSEFTKITKIMISNYGKYLNIHKNIYDNIVKKYVDDETYNNYIKSKKEHKIQCGKDNGRMNNLLLSLNEMEVEFKKTFNGFKKEYNKLPSRRIFNNISKHDDSVYRKRFNTSWTEICKMYGYDISDKCSSEYIILCKLNKILNEQCIRQKTWNWLIGTKGYKLRVDGYYESYNLVIEFDGKQHREPIKNFGGDKAFKLQQKNDIIKDVIIPQHNIKLIRISAFEDWFNEDYLKQILIKNQINIPNNVDKNKEIS